MKDYINKRIEGRNAILESNSIVMEFFAKSKNKNKGEKLFLRRYDDKEVKGKIKEMQNEIKGIFKKYDLPDLRLCGNADLYGSYDPDQEYFESNDEFNIVRCSVENEKHEKELNELVKEIKEIVNKYNIFLVSVEHDKNESYIYVDLKFTNEYKK